MRSPFTGVVTDLLPMRMATLVGLVHFCRRAAGFPTIHCRQDFGDIGRGLVRYQTVMQSALLIERAATLDGAAGEAAE